MLGGFIFMLEVFVEMLQETKTMHMYRNLFGTCSQHYSNEGNFLDLQSLINKLLLFNTFILRSPNLREIPYLVRDLGFEDTLLLLSSDALRICCELRLVGQIGQTDCLVPGGKILPLCSYSVSYGSSDSYDKWISDQLKHIGTIDLTNNQIKRLKLAVVRALDKNSIKDCELSILNQTNQDLASNRGIEVATAISLTKIKGFNVKPTDFSIRLHQIYDGCFKAETNLGEIFSIDEIEVHKVVENAVLGIAGLNQRIAEMKVHNALSGFLESETPLFDAKLDFLFQALDPNKLEKNLNRVFALRGFSDIFTDSIQTVNVEKLLKVRDSQELNDFRQWLFEIDTTSDAEIIDRIEGLRSKLGIAAHGNKGKIARFLTSTLVGSLPVVGSVAGIGLGFVDTFLLEKILPYSGVVAFIDKLYPSLFESR